MMAEHSSSTGNMNRREHSGGNDPTFLGISVEIRQMIFQELFTSTTAYHGEMFLPKKPKMRQRAGSQDWHGDCFWTFDDAAHGNTANPPTMTFPNIKKNDDPRSLHIKTSHNTSVLRTCRQFYTEAAPLFAPNILLQFSSTAAMLDTMSTIPASIISNLRHMRVRASTVRVAFPPSNNFPTFPDYHFFGMPAFLPMFPGLQLDVLTVESWFGEAYERGSRLIDMEQLLAHKAYKEAFIGTNGWKELRCIIQTSNPVPEQYYSSTYPEGWCQGIRTVYEREPDARVEIYFANEKSLAPFAGLSEYPRTRTLFDSAHDYGHSVRVSEKLDEDGNF